MSYPSLRSSAFQGLSAPVQGALYMTAAAFCFALMNAIIRYTADSLDPLQIAFFRNLFALAFMLPWLWTQGLGGLRTRRLRLHIVRGLVGYLSMVLWFFAIALLPLAEAVALNFTVPLFVTAGAAVFLGEIVRARRWSATAIGFIGVLIILRPGFGEVSWVTSLPVLAAAVMAATALMVKSLSETESPSVIVLYMNLFLTPLSLIPALFVWQWPSWPVLGLLVLLGLFAVLAHLAFTRAYAKADASAVMPFDYARLPFVAIIGYLVFSEATDLWIWLGAAVIAGSAIYIARREATVAKERPVSGAAGHSVQGRG